MLKRTFQNILVEKYTKINNKTQLPNNRVVQKEFQWDIYKIIGKLENTNLKKCNRNPYK